MNIIAVLSFCIALNAQDTGVEFSKTDLISGVDFKSWYLSKKTPELSSVSCNAGGQVLADNIYRFHRDGTFDFDHGNVTQDSLCASEPCCGDLVNFRGKWKFTNNQSRLVITALEEIGNSNRAMNVVIFDAAIDHLDEDVLIITVELITTHEKRTLEFRKKI